MLEPLFMYGYGLWLMDRIDRMNEDDELDMVRYTLTVKTENEQNFLEYAKSARIEILSQFNFDDEIIYIAEVKIGSIISMEWIESMSEE